MITFEQKLNIILEATNQQPYYVDDAGAAGKGLFASQDIEQGTVFLKMQCIPIPDKDWKLLQKTRLPRMYGFDWNGKHIVTLGKDLPGWMTTEEAKIVKQTILRKGLHPFYFANDGRNNSNAKEFVKGDTIYMQAIKPIKKGDEITKKYDKAGASMVKKNSNITTK